MASKDDRGQGRQGRAIEPEEEEEGGLPWLYVERAAARRHANCDGVGHGALCFKPPCVLQLKLQ